MANFNSYLPLLHKVEGGYQNLAKDRGNYNSLGQNVGTNFGIAATTYESYIKRPPTVVDMKNMTIATANKIYKLWYWDKLKGDNILNQSIANVLVDHGVNAGVPTARFMIQKILKNDFNQNINVDGVVGNNTVAAINSVNQLQLFDKIKSSRLAHYDNIGGSFYQSWVNRLKAFTYTEKKKAVAIGIGGILILTGLGIYIYKNYDKWVTQH